MGTYLSDFRQGNTKSIKIDYGAGVDITGWSFEFILKEDINSTKISYTISTTVGDNPNDDAPNGLCYITVPSDAVIKAGKYYYGIRVNKGGNPAIIHTILPPIDDYKDQIQIIPKV